MKNKVTVRICSQEYTISAVESEEYIMKVASTVDRKMSETMELSPRLSITSAAVLTAVNMCDEAYKAQSACDNLRQQIKQYLDDASKYRQEADEAKREIMRLRSELQEAKLKNASQGRQ